MSEVTRILNSIDHGDPKAAEELLPLVYEELRKLARAQMANEKPGQTLQATALVHEAYLHLIGSHETDWHGRNHFFMAAAESMRRILIWNARKKQRLKRGGHLKRTVLEEIQIATKAELVKLRFFIGLTNLEAAKVLQISEKTANRYWVWARAWLFDAISRSRQNEGT
jgi:RNA polymerase sigma factor (TIGR02999 family)